MPIVSIPHLPNEQVCVAVSAVPIPGVRCIPTVPLPQLPAALSVHADLQLCHLQGRYLLSCPETYVYYREKLSPLGFKILCGENYVGSTYPQDAAYNIVSMGDTAFYNEKTADPVAVRFFSSNKIKSIFVRQGYTKCALLPISKTALITADNGIARRAETNGFSVLRIEAGGVKLAGFPYGFIGGASFKINRDTVYMTGSMHAHLSKQKMVAFLEERGIKLMEGCEEAPVDIGSVIPLIAGKGYD